MYAAIIAAVVAIAGAIYGSYGSAKAQREAKGWQSYQAQLASDADWRSTQFRLLQDSWRGGQFKYDLSYKAAVSKGAHDAFLEDAKFQAEMLEFDVQQREGALKSQYENEKSTQLYAADYIKNAWEAAGLDFDALTDKVKQLGAATENDTFERDRRQKHEQAMYRVVQADAGVEGNTTKKTLQAAAMQSGMDKGLLERNLRNSLEQVRRESKLIEANAKGRQNEALSQVINKTKIGSTLIIE